MKHFGRYLLAAASAAFSSQAHAAPASFNLEHTAYSSGRGTRSVGTFDAVVRMAEDTKAILSLSGGQRRGQGVDRKAVRMAASLRHDWSSRLYTESSVGVASNGEIFARTMFGQDIGYRLSDNLTATVGAKYSSWAGGDHVKTWSAGAAYYAPGFSATYRYSLIGSSKLGGSHAHLASFRVKDPGGEGITQLWLGAGTSLYDVNPLAADKSGRFKSATLRREQPIANGLAFTAGVGRSWFDAPTGHYTSTTLLLGFNLSPRENSLSRSPAAIQRQSQ